MAAQDSTGTTAERPRWWRNAWLWAFAIGVVGLTATRSCFRHVPDAPDVVGQVPELEAWTADGETATGWARPGEVWVLGLFCGDETPACEASNDAMRKVALALETTGERPITLVSAWPGGAQDDAKAARRAVARTRATLPGWQHVLVPDGDALRAALSTARAAGSDELDGPLWSTLVLVDGEGGIRGFYEHGRYDVVSELYHRVGHVRSASARAAGGG